MTLKITGVSLFLVFSDHLVHQMNECLIKNEGRFEAELLIPSKLQRLCLEGDQVGQLYATYSTDIHIAEDVFVREIQRWRTRWGMMNEKPSTLAKPLSLTNKDLYPSIYTILSILLTMSSSSATTERSFSAMKRIKKTIFGQLWEMIVFLL